MEATSRAQAAPDSTRVMTLYGQAMTRSGSVFTLGLAGVVPFSVLSLAITTRFLSVADFGRLSVLFAMSSVVAILCGVGFLQGSMILAYRSVGDEDGDFGDVEDDDEELADRGFVDPEAKSDERRRLLGSGLLIVIGMSTVACGLVALLAPALSALVFGGGWTGSIRWMAAAAWTSGIWRMVHQVPRLERRAWRWTALQFVRPALVVGGSTGLLVAGFGVNGVLIATAVGTSMAIAIAFLVSRRCFRFAPHRGDVGRIWKKGRKWVGIELAVTIQGNASVLLLGVLATPTSVGLFQVASRIAQMPNYFAQGFITAWPAMELSPISVAAQERKGEREYSASVFTLFALSTLGLLMATSLLSGVLIQIAAPSFASAAGLIPVIAAGLGALSVFHGVYRATRFRRRRWWYMLLTFLWLLPFAGAAALLIPWKETYGIAIAQLVATAMVAFLFVQLDKRGLKPTPFQWKRLGIAFLVAASCVVVVQLTPSETFLHAILSVIALVAFPLLLLRTGTVPRAQIPIVKAIIGSLVPRRLPKADIQRRLASMPEAEREALQLMACERQEPQAAAASLGVSPSLASARLVRGLRRFADGGRATPVDHLIAGYVLHRGPTIERDAWATELRGFGVDPLELHLLDGAIQRVSKVGVSSTGHSTEV